MEMKVKKDREGGEGIGVERAFLRVWFVGRRNEIVPFLLAGK